MRISLSPLLRQLLNRLYESRHQVLSGSAYPYTFTLSAVLAYWGANFLQGSTGSVLIAFLLGIGLCLVLSLFLLPIVRNPAKRALVLLLLLLPLLEYGRLYNWAYATGNFDLYFHRHILAIGASVAIGIPILTLFFIRNFPPTLTRALNVFTLIMLLESSGGIAQAIVENRRVLKQTVPVQLSADSVKPDIYYLVFDEYTGPQALQDLYGYDDSGFTQQLQKQGFYVADQSTSNYFGSLHSLASTFNMQFLDPLTQHLTSEDESQAVLQDLMNDSSVVRSLKTAGYRYYQLGSWFQATRSNSNATANFPAPNPLHLPSFTYHLLADDSLFAPYADNQLFSDTNRTAFTYQLSKTAAIAAKPSDPKFVFAHILAPHGPNVWSAQCQPTVGGNSTQAYLDQLTCVNQQILSLVNQIKASSPTPPVIIVQSDEGQELKYPTPSSTTDPAAAFEERYATLSAFYFPDGDYTSLYPTITSVNTFRVVLNQYLGANLPLLPDTNYLLGENYEVNNSVDVTSMVQSALLAGAASP